jgi:hypothetical protein
MVQPFLQQCKEMRGIGILATFKGFAHGSEGLGYRFEIFGAIETGLREMVEQALVSC